MNVLGVESSCDETAISVVVDGRKVLSSLVASSADLQAGFGGVVPELAARKHLENIGPLYHQALQESGLKATDLDLISVSRGPGLVGALLVGVSFARGLAAHLNVPLVGVNHVHSHVHGALLGLSGVAEADIFPCYAYVISGGHSNLYHMASASDFTLKAYSIDDACGECFDKVAKMMNLGYPGGPPVEKAAKLGDGSSYVLPKMLKDPKKARLFSYSGLKTHMALLIDKERKKNADEALTSTQVQNLCASFQREAFRQLIDKLSNIMAEDNLPTKSLVVAGGVAANAYFRQSLAEKIPLKLYFPSLAYCSDNAAMIAAYGWHRYHKEPKIYSNDADWDVFSCYPFHGEDTL